MITINLVPQEYKDKIERKRIYISIKEALLIVLLFASVASILLILSKFYLEDQLINLTDQNSQGIAAAQIVNAKVKNLNNKIDEAYSIQKNFQKWTSVISEINSSKGPNIAYSTTNILRQQSTVEINGVAKTRNDLLDLQKKLENVPYFSKVNLPIGNLISKDNNSFNIRIDIDLTKLP